MATSQDTTPTTSVTAYTLIAPTLHQAVMIADDVYTYNTPNSLEISAKTTTSGRLGDRDFITVTMGSSIFVENVTKNLSLVSGFSGCKSTLEIDYEAKSFRILLFNKNNNTMTSC